MKVSRQILRVSSAKIKHGNQLIDLKGLIFGHLRVLEVDDIKSSKVTGKHMANAYWRCLCDLCGCVVSVRSSYLRKGITRLCGSCSSAARIRYFEYVRGIRKAIWGIPEEEEKPQKKNKLKIRKVPPGTYKFVIISFSYKGEAAYKQIRPLRNTGTSIRDIAELLELTEKAVRDYLKDH